MAEEKRYAVITADIVGSRTIESFTPKRDKKLREISEMHLRQKLILSPYTVTAWDEFQVLLAKPEDTPKVMLDLRRLFYPLHLWIAVGIGLVSEAHKRPINQHAGGPAFERARIAIERLSKKSAKFRILSSFESGSMEFDSIANTIYHLHDTLVEGTTAKQWSAINALMDCGSQEETAAELGVDVSTVSRTLKRGHYWHMIETIETMRILLRTPF
jgi:hypothetical protein